MLTEVPDQPAEVTRPNHSRLDNEQPPKMGLNEDITAEMGQDGQQYESQGGNIQYVTNENTEEQSENGLQEKPAKSRQSTMSKNRVIRGQRRHGSMSQLVTTRKAGTVNLAMQILNMDEEEKR